MTEPGSPTPQLRELAPVEGASRGFQVSRLVEYIETNRAGFTEEVLVDSARRGGYPEDVIEEARVRARAREASEPTRRRARRWILVAYLVTFAVLTLGMLASPYAGQYGAGYIGTIILAVTLVLGFLLSMGWLGWRAGKASVEAGASLVVFLTVPVILLVAVAGMCVATGLPIPRSY
jgi:polyferredoxin